MKLVDISAWQEKVDWEGIVNEGIEGVIVKLGENGALDEMFIDHVNNAVANGLKYGIYFYSDATTPDEARNEAIWVNDQVKTYLNGICPELGIWFDAEDKKMQKGDVTAACSAFISYLNEQGYTYVGVYSSYNWLANGIIDMAQLADYVPYWVAQYNRVCDLKIEQPNKIIRIWQYTDHYSDQLPYDGNKYYE